MTDVQIQEKLPLGWMSFEMDVDNVWDGFFLNALLRDRQEQMEEHRLPLLILQHNASSQLERLAPALHEHNKRMVGPGQEAWNHACDRCCWISDDGHGNPGTLHSLFLMLGLTAF